MTDNIGLFLVPQKADPKDGTIFVAAVAADNKAEGKVLRFDAFPPEWSGKTTEHTMPVTMLEGIGFKPEYFAEEQITDLVLIESQSTDGDVDPFLFGRKKIAHNSLLAWKRADGGLLYLHCEKCAMVLVQFLTEGQEAWSRPLN